MVVMRLDTNRTEFDATYTAGKPQLVWSTQVADLETPVSAMFKLAAEEPYSFLLESVEGGAVRGRYSFIGSVSYTHLTLPTKRIV